MWIVVIFLLVCLILFVSKNWPTIEAFVCIPSLRKLFHYRDLSPFDFDRLLTAANRFEKERSEDNDVHVLTSHMQTVLTHANELKFYCTTRDQQEKLERIIDECQDQMSQTVNAARTTPNSLEWPTLLGNFYFREYVNAWDSGKGPM
jgi:maltooligosyltrehalose synthase